MASEIKEFPERFDVIVAGGGVAGTVAALAAARTGAKTLVIEKLNCLGGNFTAGIMGTTWTFNDQEKVIVRGIPLDLIERLKRVGAVVSTDITKDAFTIYDTELAKFILIDMAEECGLNIKISWAWSNIASCHLPQLLCSLFRPPEAMRGPAPEVRLRRALTPSGP